MSRGSEKYCKGAQELHGVVGLRRCDSHTHTHDAAAQCSRPSISQQIILKCSHLIIGWETNAMLSSCGPTPQQGSRQMVQERFQRQRSFHLSHTPHHTRVPLLIASPRILRTVPRHHPHSDRMSCPLSSIVICILKKVH